MISNVIKSEEGMALVFDERGNQMSEYQGKYEDVREKILRDAPPNTLFWHAADWRKRSVAREDW